MADKRFNWSYEGEPEPFANQRRLRQPRGKGLGGSSLINGMEQLSLLEQAYWELAFAASNVNVQLEALRQARTQVESNERQVQAGTLADIDVVEAQTQVATFEQDLASAQLALTQAENRLKSLMLANRESPLWNQALLPTALQDRTVPSMQNEAFARAHPLKQPGAPASV